MICPRCKEDMIVVEHQQVELDYCPACEGIWFDAGELALLLETMKLEDPEMTVQSIAKLPEVAKAGKTARCPICGKNMAEVAVGEPPLNIDVCRNTDGLWFDGGEVHQLLRQLAAGAVGESGEKPVFEFLGEVFKGKE